MTIRRELTVIDGRPTWHYTCDGAVVLSGIIVGHVETTDGTRYDVTPDALEVNPDHAGEVAHLISVRYEDEGHPNHLPNARDPHPEPFLHLCTSLCGEAARDATDPMQAMALAAAQLRTDRIADGDVRDLFAAALGTAAGGASMALASVTAENAALNGLDGTGSTNVIPFVSLHTATPGTTGASESASTTRLACSWNGGASGAKTNSSTLGFTTPGTVACTHVGTWSLVSAGVYAIGGALTASVTAASITIAAGGISWSAA